MSGLGHEATSGGRRTMSALPAEADIARHLSGLHGALLGDSGGSRAKGLMDCKPPSPIAHSSKERKSPRTPIADASRVMRWAI
jgi:hypothetical protein